MLSPSLPSSYSSKRDTMFHTKIVPPRSDNDKQFQQASNNQHSSPSGMMRLLRLSFRLASGRKTSSSSYSIILVCHILALVFVLRNILLCNVGGAGGNHHFLLEEQQILSPTHNNNNNATTTTMKSSQQNNSIESFTSSSSSDPLLLYKRCKLRSTQSKLSQSAPGIFAPQIREISTLHKHPGMTHHLVSVHIYKNGGTSIDRVFQAHGGKMYKMNRPGGIPTNVSHALTQQKAESDWFRFAVVRDPVTRAISAYHEMKRRVCMKHPYQKNCPPPDNDTTSLNTTTTGLSRQLPQTANDMDASLFVKEFHQILDKFSRGQWKRAFPESYHLIPQVSFTHNQQLQPFEFDALPRFEQLDQDFSLILQTTNVPKTTTTTQISMNSSSQLRTLRKHNDQLFTLEDLPKETLHLICKIYQDDFCCFGYPLPTACTTNNDQNVTFPCDV